MMHATMPSIRELVKQIAVWLGIVVLLPLSVWFGTSVVSPPPDSKDYATKMGRLEGRIMDTKDPAAKEKLRDERDRLEAELNGAYRVYFAWMFWVAYPIGLVAILIGTFFPVQAVGGGLMFGGLSCLAMGCYSYWDTMDGGLRFGSLVVALLMLILLGTLRFWPLRQFAAPW
jgi:hypothetical protein